MELDRILHGKCLEVLRTFPDESVDSVVTDPPYGLGDRSPTVEEIIAYLQGADLDMGGEFQNKDWEIPSVLVWKEVWRVLKPGGYLFVFAGTRTLDIMSIGIRAVGFENRDMMDAEWGPPVLRWLRAQGMPKSTNISKEIDRKLSGTKRRKKGEPPPVVEQTTEGKEWEGFGTGLKPYWEPILVFRKPIQEPTVVEQVLKTRTGAINIDASRVKHASAEDFAKHKAGVDAIKARGGTMGNSWKNSSDLSEANEVTADGRFPPNVLLVHSDACRQVGTEKVQAPVINRFDDGAKPFGGGAGHEYTTVPRGDANGQEEVAVWECHPSCPAYQLNQQSGVTVSRPDNRDAGEMDTRTGGSNWRFKRQPSKLSDSGGASRFFMNFPSDFFYVPKPSEREKNDGLEGEDSNEHPTVKPVLLMQYLVRMATPPRGLVVDPYCGSGTTCVAAAKEGFHFIGIDKDKATVKTARGRCAKAIEERDDREAQRQGFEAAMSLPDE